jgi:hypothetical protein
MIPFNAAGTVVLAGLLLLVLKLVIDYFGKKRP